MKLERIRRISKIRGYLSPLFSNNPVLIRGLAMVPVIVVSNTLRNAVAISIVIACMALPVHLLTNFFGGKIPRWFRVPAYVLLSSLFFIPAALLMNRVVPYTVDGLGVFLPLLVINSMVIGKAEEYAVRHKFIPVVVDALLHIAGFALVMCTIGLVREFLSSATIWGQPIEWMNKIPAFALPFCGFMIVAFLAAGAKAYRRFTHRILLAAAIKNEGE